MRKDAQTNHAEEVVENGAQVWFLADKGPVASSTKGKVAGVLAAVWPQSDGRIGSDGPSVLASPTDRLPRGVGGIGSGSSHQTAKDHLRGWGSNLFGDASHEFFHRFA
mgnify:CR=1 FL=1